MTRFDADDDAGRRKLLAEAIRAHRERGSAYLTVEADAGAVAEDAPVPWVQFADDENVINLDCTDAELQRLEALLEAFPAFKIRELNSPEDADGTNVRVGALADRNRVAQFVDRLFREVYDLPEDYRLWVAEL